MPVSTTTPDPDPAWHHTTLRPDEYKVWLTVPREYKEKICEAARRRGVPLSQLARIALSRMADELLGEPTGWSERLGDVSPYWRKSHLA